MGKFIVEKTSRPRRCHRCLIEIPADTFIFTHRHARYCHNICPTCLTKMQFECIRSNAMRTATIEDVEIVSPASREVAEVMETQEGMVVVGIAGRRRR